METKKYDDLNDPLGEREDKVLFLRSEINTMESEIMKNNAMYGDRFFSIILKLMPVERSIALIFKSLEVLAVDQDLFNRISQGNEYRVPLFKGI
jgi:hypothetical protein